MIYRRNYKTGTYGSPFTLKRGWILTFQRSSHNPYLVAHRDVPATGSN